MYVIKKTPHSLNGSYTSFSTFTEIKYIAKRKVILINTEIRFKTTLYIFNLSSRLVFQSLRIQYQLLSKDSVKKNLLFWDELH